MMGASKDRLIEKAEEMNIDLTEETMDIVTDAIINEDCGKYERYKDNLNT